MLIYQTNNSWIVGSIHVLTEQLSAALEPVLAQLIDMADIIFLEAAMPDSEPPRARLLGTSLRELSGPELYEQVTRTAVSIGLDPASFTDCSPWWAALRLGVHRLSAAGFNPTLGIELTMHRLLQAAGKRPLLLEHSLQGLRCFDQAPLEEQLRSLRMVAEGGERVTAEFDLLLRGWVTGATEILEQLLESRLRLFPNTFHCLITERNYAWLSQLDQLLRCRERSMVVVGALHLVGDSGLIAMLEQDGHHIQRLDR